MPNSVLYFYPFINQINLFLFTDELFYKIGENFLKEKVVEDTGNGRVEYDFKLFLRL